MTMPPKPSRRAVLKGAGAAAALAIAPGTLRAQAGPLKLGVLTPLTGAGSTDGPRMLAAMQSVAKEVNAAGGVLGRSIDFVVEDDQTNPDAAVRAARKLIDVDQVPVIMGTWASAVTTAVAPLCWESKVFLTTCSGADPITKLPHQGYLVRTQPNNFLQATHHGDFIAALGMKRVFALSIQSPFTVPTHERLHDVLAEKGSALVGTLTYDKDKTSYRSEIDQALKTKPDMIYLNGYAPDETIVLKDLYKAGYEGAKFSQSYSVTQPVLDALPHEVTEGIYTVQPSADVDSKAFALAVARLGSGTPDTYYCQATDWISLVSLAIAKAGAATGTAIRDNIRKISQGSGTKVYSAVEGLSLLAKGQEINYEGASGPCDFTDIGDIIDCKFRFAQVANGKFNFIKIA
jgi:ABC-type branched-subunit amino acid transport system substrate-binding protein